jgi:putative ubiquitin-RnfH superfamily antitoxin RatB of RatAB toxin-antitoxin module
MSPQAIQNDLGVAARRLKVSLHPGSPQAAQAEALVRQGASVEDAVQASALPAKVKLSAAESTVYDALRKSGLSDEQAAKLLTATRTLNANLPTDAEVQAAVRKRNETGRWE